MATSYDIFIEAFLSKTLEYKYLSYVESEITKEAVVYLKQTLSKFKHYCSEYDLSTYDDETNTINVDLGDDEDEIVDIVSDGMVVQWLHKYVANSDNLENFLSTKDFEAYSAANLTYRNRELYSELKKDFINECREYSFNHNDLGEFYT